MSGQAPQRPSRSRLAQTRPIRKLTGRSVQARQRLPASRVIVTVQEDPNAPGLANVQIMRRVARTSSQPQQSTSSAPSISEQLTNKMVSLISSLFSAQTPAQRLEQAREEQRKIDDVVEADTEEGAK